jgi:hypothetical protein
VRPNFRSRPLKTAPEWRALARNWRAARASAARFGVDLVPKLALGALRAEHEQVADAVRVGADYPMARPPDVSWMACHELVVDGGAVEVGASYRRARVREAALVLPQ